MENFKNKNRIPAIVFLIWTGIFVFLCAVGWYIGIKLLLGQAGDNPVSDRKIVENMLIMVCVLTFVLIGSARVLYAAVRDKLKDDASEAAAGSKGADVSQMRDPLTGIRNIEAYAEEVKKLNSELGTGIPELGIALVDLNGLKTINETCGHDKGDEAIKSLCFIVCHVFEHSPVFRINGDQFVVILKNIDLQNIDFLLEAFDERLERLKRDDSLNPWEKISAAIGVAFYDPEEDKTVENTLKRAEKVMFANKGGSLE